MNCKPGDLAVVVRSKTPANMGKIVRVVQPYEPGQSGIVLRDFDGFVWLCDTAGSDLVWDSAWGCGLEYRRSGPVPDACLRPLRPGEDVDDNDVYDTVPSSPETAVA
jgi:hypothetical protein